MIIKNSFSILASEFRLVYKMLIYVILILLVFLAIFIGLAGPAFRPLQNVLLNANVIQDLKGAVESFTMGGGFAPFIDSVLASLSVGKAVIEANVSSLIGPICLLVFALFVFKFLITLVSLPVSEVFMQFMSTSAHAKLLPSYVFYIKKSLLYSLMYCLIVIPFDAAIFIIAFFIIKLYSVINLFAFSIAVGFIFFAFSLRLSLFSMWVPSIVVGKLSIFKALKNNFKIIKNAFIPALSCNFIIIIATFCMSIAFGLITFGIATLILFPFGICFSLCVHMVVYYNGIERKYYTDQVTIVDSSEDLTDKN